MHGRRRDGWFSEEEQGGGCYEYDEEKQREFDREEGREEGREEERQNTLREKARADEEKLRADEAFRKIAILEKQLAELMK